MGQTDRKKPVISVYFTDGHNTGKQNLLQFMPTAKCESGSQPLFRVANTAAGKETSNAPYREKRHSPSRASTGNLQPVRTAVSATKAQADATALMGTSVLLVIM